MGNLDHIAREIGSEIKRIQDDLDSKIQVVEERTTQVEEQAINIEPLQLKVLQAEDMIKGLDTNLDQMNESFKDAQLLLQSLPDIQKLIALLPELEKLIDLHSEDNP